MFDYLYRTSDFNLFSILIVFFISMSLVALILIKRYMPLHLRYQENAVIGCTSALVAVIYGVLAGFAAMYLINNNSFAANALQREANAITSIYLDSVWLSEPVKARVQADIKHYLDEILNVEWPLMNAGQQIDNAGDFILKDISDQLSQYKIKSNSDSLIVAEMLQVARNLYDARQQRIQMSQISLSNEVWVVILVGTILTLCVSYLFGVNFYLHVFIAIAAALMVSSTIFLLISLDKPFQGDYVVGPGQYKSVQRFIHDLNK